MKKLKKYSAFFLIGGVGYGTMEIVWRGHTHWTMVIAGGICFIAFSLIAEKFKDKPLVYKAALCAIVITSVEFIFGVIFNLYLKMNVWNYSKLPLNILGQICPLFTLLWGVMGLVFVPLADKLNEQFEM